MFRLNLFKSSFISNKINIQTLCFLNETKRERGINDWRAFNFETVNQLAFYWQKMWPKLNITSIEENSFSKFPKNLTNYKYY